MSDLTVLVYETAIVFEGEKDSYRYDLTGHGLATGNHVDAVVEEVRDHVAAHWPDVTIEVKGEEQYCHNLIAALRATGATVLADEEYDDYDPVTDEEIEVEPSGLPPQDPAENTRRPLLVSDLRHKEKSWGNIYLYCAIGVVVLFICGVCFWAVDSPQQPVTSAKATASAMVPLAVGASTSNAAPASTVTMEYKNIHVGLPHGYRITEPPEKPGMFVALGADDNLRITIAIDPLIDADPAAVFAELDAMILRDPALAPVDPLGIGRGQEKDYVENPGDGSTVHWVVWIDAGHVFSVGCHTREGAANLPQRATCRRAAETLTIAQN
ncbi:MAG: type VII secretion-associated protein [Corynebacterium sp.]|nr:type VII secretion-associated protein [Corynebacterium sp.]